MSDPSGWLSAINTVFDRFERYLRWVYPGLLFMVLLRMARPEDFKAIDRVFCDSYWDLIVAGIVAGIVIYLFQGYFVGQVIEAIGVCCRWDVNALLPDEKPRDSGCFLVKILKRQAVSMRSRRRSDTEESLSLYFDYSWAAYHAMFITGGLTTTMFFLKDGGSVLDEAGLPVLIPAILLMLGALWRYAQLTRVRFEVEPSQEDAPTDKDKPRGNVSCVGLSVLDAVCRYLGRKI